MDKFEKIDLGLKEAYEELFMTDKGREEFRAPKVMDIEISKIDTVTDDRYYSHSAFSKGNISKKGQNFVGFFYK